MIKKGRLLFIVMFSFILSSFVFAKSGALSGSGKLKVVKTQWFDIIYPEESELSASILYENADSVYEEIAEFYGKPIPCRMPVVITPSIEVDNAYFTTYPYNHIVIYDTAVIDDLNVFSNTLLSTFKHELTHAYTYNMKSGFWKFFNRFSDSISMQMLTVNSGMAEGATVSTESATGEGRMNDEYSLQMIKQAIIEDDFPGYADVRGARDVYPYGGYYYFNGAFHKWLQDTYGMEKYADWWYRCINKSISNNWAFYKAYKIKYKDAWNLFKTSFYVPDVYSNPVEAAEVQDFFEPDSGKYSSCNNSGSIYSNLFMTDAGLFYSDESCENIYFVRKDKLQNKKIKGTKICQNVYFDDLSVSDDGKYFVITYHEQNTATLKLRNALYSFDGKSAKKIYTFDETGYFCSSILHKDGKYYLFAINYTADIYTLIAKEIVIEKNEAHLGNTKFTKRFPLYTNAADFVQCGNDNFAFIKKSAMDYSICICDFDGNVLDEVMVPEEGISVKNLSYNQEDNRLLFSWAKKGTMPRLGFYNIDEMAFSMSQKDISGGVYNPVAMGKDLIFRGTFYKENRIFVKADYENTWDYDEVFADFSDADEVFAYENYEDEDENEAEKILNEVSLSSFAGNYNPLNFYKKGIIIPIPRVSSHSIGSSYSTNVPLGCEYISSNPWGSDTITLDFGTNFSLAIFKAALASGTDTSVFSYNIASQSEFSLRGWKYSDISAGVSSKFHLPDFSRITVYADTSEGYGNISLYNNPVNPFAETLSKEFIAYNDAGISYSNISQNDSGKYSWKGFSARVTGYYEYERNCDDIEASEKDRTYKNFDIQLATKAYIPHLIPVKNPVGIVANLPLRFDAILFPTESQNVELKDRYYIKNADDTIKAMIPAYALQVESELVLYAKDIQKSISNIPVLLFNDFRISLCTKGGFEMPYEMENQSMKILSLGKYPQYIKDGTSKFSTLISLKAVLSCSSNFGSYTGNIQKYLCAEVGILPVNRETPLSFIHVYADMEF